MPLSRGPRRLLLTTHVMASVGWLGLTLGLLTLGAEGLATPDPSVYRSIRVLVDWPVLVVSLLSLTTGVALSAGTPWGLLRHWWVVAKLALTLVATGLSVFALRPLAHTAAATLGGGGSGTDLVVAPSVALVVYGTATALSVYKPRGRTPFVR